MQTLSIPTLPDLMTKLAVDLEAGGFERFFLNHGEATLPCAYALEEMYINGADVGASALFWEATAIVGTDTHWNDPEACKSAIASLSAKDREHLRVLSEGVLDYLFDMEFDVED